MDRRYAVTGGIGSGKSTVMRCLKELGYPTFSCDEIYRELCGEAEFLSALSARFHGVVKAGVLDRAALARTVFSDASARRDLDAISHPRIMERLFSRMEGPLSFAEVPLLFEGGYADKFDGVIAVMRKKEARIASLKTRDGLNGEEIARRMDSQRDWDLPPEGAIVLFNDGSERELFGKVKELVQNLF